MPAPPARMRSASVPWGLNSISSSLARNCWAKVLFSDIGRDHFLDLPGIKQHAETLAVDAAIIGDDGDIFHSGIADGEDQGFGDAAKAKPPRHDRHAVFEQTGQRGMRVRIDLIHERSLSCPEMWG